MANLRAYGQMVDEAEKYSLPKTWPTDLYCVDRAYMEWDNAPRTFGWILRESGTHLIMSKEDKAAIEYWTQNRGSEMFYLYWYDGDWLRTIERAEMLQAASELPSWNAERDGNTHGIPTRSPGYIWLTNRIEQLHIQEEARRGRVRDHLSLVELRPSYRNPLSVEHISFQFPYIDSLGHWSDKLKPR